MSDILGSVKEMELKVFKENEMVQVDFLGTPTDYVQLDM